MIRVYAHTKTADSVTYHNIFVYLHVNSGREWTGSYTTEFWQILPTVPSARFASEPHIAKNDEDADDAVRVSLVTGRVMATGRRSQPSVKAEAEVDAGRSDTSLITIGDRQIMAAGQSVAAARLLQHSWRGLEVALGETSTAVLEKGLSGIAKHYDSEPQVLPSSVFSDVVREHKSGSQLRELRTTVAAAARATTVSSQEEEEDTQQDGDVDAFLDMLN
jgi:hypothetical protein